MIYAPESSFDVLISASVKRRGEEDVMFSLSLQPQYADTSFQLRLNIDPSHIFSYRQEESFRFYWNYFTSFIDVFSYSADELFSIRLSDDVIIPSDPFGITSAITDSFQDGRFTLPLISTLDTGLYSHIISYSDISLSSDTGFFIYQGNTSFPSSSANAGLALLATTDHLRGGIAFYPQIYVYKNFIDSSDATFSLQFSTAFRIESGIIDGGGLSLSLPFTFDDFSFINGIALTNGELQYGQYLNGYETNRTNENTLMLYSRTLYENEDFSVVADLQLPVDIGTYSVIKEEDYFSIELSTDFFGVSLAAGFRTKGLFTDFTNAIDKYRETFISMGYSNRAIRTYLSFFISQNQQPSITLSTSLSTYHALFSRDRDLGTSPGWFDYALYSGYMQDTSPSVFLRPVIRFNWSRESNIAVRIPLSFSIKDGKLRLNAGNGIDSWYDFGFGQDSTFNVIYDFITDIFTLAESIHIGGEDIGIYMTAERKGKTDISLFDSTYRSYGTENQLSLLVGFSFENKAQGKMYVNNMENPDIFALSIAISPMGEKGPQLVLDSALDILFRESGFDASLVISFSLAKDFTHAVSASLYASTYVDFSPHSFDLHITSKEDLCLSTGVRIKAESGNFTLPFSFGFNSGSAREYYFDAFTYRNHTRIGSQPFLSPMTFFINAGIQWKNDRLSISFAWQINSFPSLFSSASSDDTVSLSASYSINDFLISADIIRKNTVSALRSFRNPKDFFLNDDTVFSLSAEKELGHLSFYVSLYAGQKYSTSSRYLNEIKTEESSTYLAFSLITSLRF